jgi:hypothetical protein
MARNYKTGAVSSEVDIFIDVSKDQIRVLSDKEELVLNKKKLPENIVRETSVWKKPSWSMHNAILSNSFIDTADGRVRFDIAKHINARIKWLLSDWSLKDADPSLKINLTGAMDGTSNTVLTENSMKVIADVDRDIITGFYTKAMAIFYPEEKEEAAPGGNPPKGV